MQSRANVSLQELSDLLGPILRPKLSNPATRVEQILTEGMVLPDAKELVERAADEQTVKYPLKDAIEWIRAVLRSDYLRSGWEKGLLAVSGAVNGQDAIIGGWKSRSRAVQVVVTMERIHVLTRLPRECSIEDPPQAAREVVENAMELLAIDELPALDEWKLKPVAGLLLGMQQVRTAREWFETLFFMTDGRGVKYSALKFRNRDLPQRISAVAESPPWFASMRAAQTQADQNPTRPPAKNETDPWVD